MCEAIAVAAAADRPLRVRAQTSASPFHEEPTIAVLEVDLGLPGSGPDDGEAVQLGDLPVDRCGMVLGDALALDGFTGPDGRSTDGLADVNYWGKSAKMACNDRVSVGGSGDLYGERGLSVHSGP